MKEFLKTLGIALLLSLTTIVIQLFYFGWFILQYPFIFIYGFWNREYFSAWVKQLAYSQSQTGNAQMYPTLNLFVKKGEGMKFGDNIDLSISIVSGVIKHEERYNKIGLLLAKLHNFVYKLLGVNDHLEDSRKNIQPD